MRTGQELSEVLKKTLPKLQESASRCEKNPFISELQRQKIIRFVPAKSLNPSDAQIRAWEVEETLRRTRKTTGELFPNAGDLYAYLSKPVNKIKYYQIARCRVKYKTA